MKKKQEKKCYNPQPSAMYSRDDMDDVHFWCKNCGKEIIEVIIKGKRKWIHGKIGYKIISDEILENT